MASLSSRWVIVLCLCLLSQQFAPAYMAHLSVNGLEKAKRSEEKDELERKSQDQEDRVSYLEEQEDDDIEGQRRGWGSLGKWTWNGIKKTVDIAEKFTDVASIVSTIRFALEGCAADFPGIKVYWKRNEELVNQFNQITADIDKEILNAYNLRDSANFSYMIHYDVRQEMERVVTEQKYAFEAMDPRFKIAINNATYELEQMIKKKKANKEEVGLLEIDKGYKTGLDLALSLSLPALSLAMPYAGKLYDHLKGGVVGRKIEELEDKFGEFTVFKSTPADKARKLKGYRSLGVTANSKGLSSKIGDMVDRMKKKYSKVKNVVSKVKKGFEFAMKVGSVVLNVWSLIRDSQDCAEKNKNAIESVAKMEDMVEENQKVLGQAKETGNHTKEALQDIFNVAWDSEFLEALTMIKKMVADTTLSKPRPEATEIINSIEAYQAASVDFPDVLFDLQNNLRKNLKLVYTNVQCFTIKGNFRNSINGYCAQGKDTFSEAYIRATKGYPYPDKIEDCRESSGEVYISESEMREAWKKALKDNSTIKEVCLMNNENRVSLVRDQLINGETNPSEIAKSLGLQNSKGILEEVEAIIKSLPSVDELPIPQEKIDMICMAKEFGQDVAAIVKKLNKYSTGRKYTTKQVQKIYDECEG